MAMGPGEQNCFVLFPERCPVKHPGSAGCRQRSSKHPGTAVLISSGKYAVMYSITSHRPAGRMKGIFLTKEN